MRLVITGKSGRSSGAIKRLRQQVEAHPGDSVSWTSPEANLRDGKRGLERALKACNQINFQQTHILSTLAAAYAECGDFATAWHFGQ